MAVKPKKTVSLSQPIMDYINDQVKEGNAPGPGWFIEICVREHKEREMSKK